MSLRNFCLLLFLFYLQLVWAWCEFDLHNQCLYNTLSKSNNFRICFHFFLPTFVSSQHDEWSVFSEFDTEFERSKYGQEGCP